jgi:hypothetical protein
MDQPKYNQKPQTPAVDLPSQRPDVALGASLEPTPPSIQPVSPDSAIGEPKKVEDEATDAAGKKDSKGNSADYKSPDAPLKADWKQ